MLKMTMSGCALVLAMTGTAGAMPMAPPVASDTAIIRVAGGCGPFYHRNPIGFCVANGFYGGYYRRLPPPCPPFYHRDPDPARPICYPN